MNKQFIRLRSQCELKMEEEREYCLISKNHTIFKVAGTVLKGGEAGLCMLGVGLKQITDIIQ